MDKKMGLAVNRTRGGKTSKIMAVVDCNGLPIAAGIAGGAEHETKLVMSTIKKRFFRKKLSRILGDRAYDSDSLDIELKKDDIELIPPHRRGRTSKKTQDGRRLHRYRNRWKVKRFFPRIHKFRRITVRWEHKAVNFLSILHTGYFVLLLAR